MEMHTRCALLPPDEVRTGADVISIGQHITLPTHSQSFLDLGAKSYRHSDTA